MPLKYGVVICPKCHYPRGVLLTSKQGICHHCGYTFTISKLKKFYETDSESELVEAVGKLNAKLQGGTEEYLQFLEEYENVPIDYEGLEPHKRIASKLRHIKEPKDRLEKLAYELSLELNEFEENDILRVLSELGTSKSQSEKLVKVMIENNIIYEPTPGKFKIVDINK